MSYEETGITNIANGNLIIQYFGNLYQVISVIYLGSAIPPIIFLKNITEFRVVKN